MNLNKPATQIRTFRQTLDYTGPAEKRNKTLLGLIFFTLALLIYGYAGMVKAACTPSGSTDWMITTDQLAQDIRPRDCATVLQSPPDFRWPDVISSGGYTLTLTYPDGHTR